MLPGARRENDAEFQPYRATSQSKKRGKKQRKKLDITTALLIVLYLLLLTFVGDLIASIIGVVTGQLPYDSIYWAALRMSAFGGLILWGISAARRYSKSVIVKRDALITKSVKCPVCESDTILRAVKEGPHTGEQFYVCVNYPECKGKIRAGNGAL
jgi:hypothetical protein